MHIANRGKPEKKDDKKLIASETKEIWPAPERCWHTQRNDTANMKGTRRSGMENTSADPSTESAEYHFEPLSNACKTPPALVYITKGPFTREAEKPVRQEVRWTAKQA
ncbi:hypothetical protein NMY22_g13615 [Coprinellus aureogranulatus]|nr:hypothetical protein NMY22_g13615 [Coprinellus aureogranulatus]